MPGITAIMLPSNLVAAVQRVISRKLILFEQAMLPEPLERQQYKEVDFSRHQYNPLYIFSRKSVLRPRISPQNFFGSFVKKLNEGFAALK